MKKLEKIKNLTQNDKPQEDPNLSPNLAPILIKYKSDNYVRWIIVLTLIFQAIVLYMIFVNFALNRQLSALSNHMDNTMQLIQPDRFIFDEVDSLSAKIGLYKNATQNKTEIGNRVDALFSSLVNTNNIFVEAALRSENVGEFTVETPEALTAALFIHRLFETQEIESIAISSADLTRDDTYIIKFEVVFK